MPKIVYDIEFKIGDSNIKTAGKQAEESLQGAKNEARGLTTEYAKAGESAEKMGQDSAKAGSVASESLENVSKQAKLTAAQINVLRNRMRGLGSATRVTSKATSSANQVFFSFSDGVQDAAQFSQGFAQGMRAIGNNVSFTAELLAQLNTTAKRTGTTLFTALKSSLGGVGGILLGINLAITATTFLLSRMGKEAKNTEKAIDSVVDSLLDFSDINKQNSRELRNQASDINIFATAIEKAFPDKAEQLRKESDRLDEQSKILDTITQRRTGLSEKEIKSIQNQISANDVSLKYLDIQAETLKLIGEQDGIGGVLFGTYDALLKNREQAFVLERRNLEQRRDLGIISNDEFDLLQKQLTNKRFQLQVEEDITKARAERALAESTEVDDSFLINLDESLFEESLELDRKYNEERDKFFEKFAEKRAMDEMRLDNMVARNKQRVTQAAYQSLLGLSEQFLGNTKAGALLQLSLEKAAAISQVVIQGNADAAKAANVAATYSAQTLTPYGFNPAAVAAAANAKAQVAKIKANTAKSVAIIAATGLGEAAGIALGSGSSGGSSDGGASGASASGRAGSPSGGSSFGITRSGEGSPTFLPSNGTLNQQPTFIIEQKVTNKGLALSVRRGNNEIRSNRVEVSG